MNDIELIKGDCIEVMKHLIDDGLKFDAIICDPPYGIHNGNFDMMIPFDKMWECLNQLIKPKGNIVLFGGGLYTYKLALSNEKKFRYEMVWKKSKCGSPLTAKYMPLKKHENILVFGEPASYYEPQMLVGKPYKRKYTPNKVNNLKYGIKGVETNNQGTRHPCTILDFPQKWRRQDQLHPTQKPVSLMTFLVKSYCPENGIVLDFAMGSGSTGVACKNTNRKFVGIEIDENYYNIAKERIYGEQAV
jgi:DNA modification methylase